MKKTFRIFIINGAILTIFNFYCYASGVGTSTAEFLRIGIGARPSAMGDAFIALADDAASLYWNPAGLAQLEKKEIFAMYNLWLEGINQGYISFTFPFSLNNQFGIGINYVDMGILEGRDEHGNPTGNFGSSDIHLSLGYAKKFNKFCVGFTVGWLQDTIREDKKSVFLGDIGLIYFINKHFNLGIVTQNIGTNLGTDVLPLIFKIGGNLKLKDLNFNIDIVKPEKEEISYHTGMEWWLKNILVVRGGYKYDSAMATLGPLAGLTAGAGFKINIFDIDYAFVPYGDLGLTHRVSLTAKF